MKIRFSIKRMQVWITLFQIKITFAKKKRK